MTEPTNRQSVGRPARRPANSGAWKSALLASGLGTVLLGWVWLAKVSPTATTQTAQPVISQSSTVIAQVPAPASTSSNQLGAQANNGQAGTTTLNNSIPSLPQQPVFQRPVTRTRRS